MNPNSNYLMLSEQKEQCRNKYGFPGQTTAHFFQDRLKTQKPVWLVQVMSQFSAGKEMGWASL